MKGKHGFAALFLPVFACGFLAGAYLPDGFAGMEEALVSSVSAAEEETYTIRFHDDFDEGEDAVFEMTASFGEVLILADCPFAHEGYVFAGWYADGYGINHALANAYAEGCAVRDLAETPGEVIELYAGWYAQRE